MRDLIFEIFSDRPCNDFTQIYLFSWTHIFYLVLTLVIVFFISIYI